MQIIKGEIHLKSIFRTLPLSAIGWTNIAPPQIHTIGWAIVAMSGLLKIAATYISWTGESIFTFKCLNYTHYQWIERL